MLGFDMGAWQVKKSKAWTWIPSSGLDTWFMGLSELVTTAPEASACMEIVPPVCKTKDFLRHDLLTLSEMWYNHCITKGEIGIGWKSKLFF